jgi:ferredoxin-NADP reductase
MFDDRGQNARFSINRLLRTRVVSAVCTPRHLDEYLELIDPTWSLHEVRARVVGIQPEASAAVSLFLQPNENWAGFRAGQFVSMVVAVDGVRYTRCFSIASAPQDGLPLRVTIKSLPGGRLGTWAARAARRNDVVLLSQALGHFVLPNPPPAHVLFISGGSGITPVMSMVRQLLATRHRGQIVCLHYAREQAIFGGEMAALASRHPGFRFVLVRTGVATSEQALSGHFSAAHLDSVAPDWADCETFVCGPAPLEAAVTRVVSDRGLAQRLHVERFTSAPKFPATRAGSPCRVTFARSRREIQGDAASSLLELAEAAGLQPVFGCRLGICHRCTCRKLSGAVVNALTGVVSSAPHEEIQLCVSAPRSEVTLEL